MKLLSILIQLINFFYKNMEAYIIQSNVLQAQHMKPRKSSQADSVRYIKKYELPFNQRLSEQTKNCLTEKLIYTTHRQSSNFNTGQKILTQRQANRPLSHNQKKRNVKLLTTSTFNGYENLIKKKQKYLKQYYEKRNVLRDLGVDLKFSQPYQKEEAIVKIDNTIKKCADRYKQKSLQFNQSATPSEIKKKNRVAEAKGGFRKSVCYSSMQLQQKSRSNSNCQQNKLSNGKVIAVHDTKRQFVCNNTQTKRNKVEIAKVVNKNSKTGTSTSTRLTSAKHGRLGTPYSKQSISRKFYDSSFNLVWKRPINCLISPQRSLDSPVRNKSLSNSRQLLDNLPKDGIQIVQKNNLDDNKVIKETSRHNIQCIKKNRHNLCKTASSIPKVINKFYNEPLCHYQWNAKPKIQKIRRIRGKNRGNNQLLGVIASFDVQNYVPLNQKQMINRNMQVMSKYSFNNTARYNQYIQNLCSQTKF